MGRAYSGNDPQALEAFAQRAGSPQVAGFVFVGYAMYMWLSTLLWGPGTALRTEQVRGSLEAVFLTPASRLVPLFGPGAANILPASLNFVVMGVAIWLLFGFVPTFQATLWTLVIIVLGVWLLWSVARKVTSGVPGRMQAFFEIVLEMVDNQSKSIIHDAKLEELVATSAGRRVVDEAEAVVAGIYADVLGALPGEERETFVHAFQLVLVKKSTPNARLIGKHH